MRNFRKALALVLALAMVLTTFGVTVVSAAQYGDTSGHWAESYIDTWSNYGVIQGDGGYFRPDDAITRAEVAQVTQNVISYVDTAENTFVDVSASDWFADAVLKLVAAGALTGNGDGTMAPNNFMTREEAMTMLARAYGLTVENSNAAITQYADYQSVSDYATGYVGTMTSNGFVGGYEDGTVRPQAYISRAEFVKLLDNMIKLYITAPGAYGPEYVSGLVMVKTGGVTINGVVAKGIVVSPQVSGDVTITGSQVSGNIVNLSKTANVTSNTGSVVNPNATTKPNTILNNYGGYSGGGSGGSSTSTVRVRFYNGSALVATKTVTKNAIMTGVPDAPAKTGYSFTGWYTTRAAAEDPENHTAFNFGSTKITSAMDFFAGYIESTDPTASPAPTATPAPTPVADLDPAAAAYAPSAATEVSTTITYKDSEDDIVVIRDTLTGVELVKDTDYTIEDNKITFTEQFLNSLYDGVHKIEIITHSSEEGTAPVFELTVTGSTVATPSPAPTATPEPTAEPTATPTAEPIGEYIVWDFGKEPFTVKQEDGSYSPNTEYFPVATNTTRNSILSNSITAERFNGLAFTTKDAIDGGYQKSAQSYDDGFAGTYQIKSGKAGSATDRVFTYTPKTNGVFTVYAKSGSGTNATTVTIEQGSNKATLEYLGTDSADGKKPGILSLEVVANQQIKIYGSNNTGYFGMKFVETVTPTEVPATATPAPTATQTPVESYVATLNVANGNGVLKDAQGNVYPTVGPATAEPTEAPTNAPTDAPTAEPTEAPTAEPIATATSEPIVTSGDNWKASAALTAGSTLLSTDNIEITNDLDAAYEEDARTVGGVEYVGGINLRAKSKTDITGDTTKNACVLTVTAKTSGVLTAAYLRQTSSGYVSGDGKDIRVSQGSTVLKADSFETYESVASGEDADARRTATSTFTLEAGQTYYDLCFGNNNASVWFVL